MRSQIRYGKISLLFMLIILLVLIYIILNIFTPVSTTISPLNHYYISSSDGNDNNPGTATEPFKTLQIIKQLTKIDGMSVHLKCNDTWGSIDNIIKTATLINWNGSTSTERSWLSAYYIENGEQIINDDCPSGQNKPTIYGSLQWHDYDENGEGLLRTGIYGRSPTGFYAPMIDIKGANITVKNIIIRDASGAGIVDYVGFNIFDGVEIHNSAQASIKLLNLNGSIIKNGHFTNIAVAPTMKYLDDNGTPSPITPGCMTLIDGVRNSIIINNIIGPCYGEAIVVGRMSHHNIISKNTFVCVRAYGGFYPGGSSMNIFERNRSVGCQPDWNSEYLRPSNMSSDGKLLSGAGFAATIEGNVDSGNGSAYQNLTRNNVFANEYAMLDYGIAKQHRNMRESNTISFNAETHEIRDSAGGLNVFNQRENKWIKVRDSKYNNGNYTIIEWGSNAIKVAESLTDESAENRIKLGKLLTPYILNNTFVGMNRYTNRWNSDVPELTILNNLFIDITENICEASDNDNINYNGHTLMPDDPFCTNQNDVIAPIEINDRQSIADITADNIPPIYAWKMTNNNIGLYTAGFDLSTPLPDIFANGFTDWQKSQLGYTLDLTYNSYDIVGIKRSTTPTLGAFEYIDNTDPPPIDPPPIDPPPIDPPENCPPITCSCSCEVENDISNIR